MRTHLNDLLTEQAAVRGSAPALTYGERTVTYATLADQVLRMAGGLQGIGVERADRVAVFAEKRIETVVALWATSAAGGVFVPVNPVLKPEQVAHILADCDVRVLVTTAARWRLVADAVKECDALRAVVLVDEVVEALSDVGTHAYAELIASAPAPARPPGVDLDLAAILYTSGSTGRPKGVVLSHRNLLVGAESVSSYLANTPDDVILAALPISFDAGLSQLTTAFAVGAHVVLANYMFPKDLVRLCDLHAVTGLTCVPPLWMQLVDVDWPQEARASMRYIANTGGRMPRATLDRLRALFPGARPFLMYGLTEAFRSTYLDPAQVDARPDSIGKAIPDAEILVVRPDGRLAGPGEEGELVHRGPLVAQGYWNDPVRTAERFRPLPGPHEGWRRPELAVWSGDTVRVDEEGYLYFVGRVDDMIKTSGYRVSPTEVEEVAYDSGLVRDAVALGVPDERLGQRIVLVVTPAAPAGLEVDQLRAILRQTLPAFMVPAEIRVATDLPRSPNGKFDRVRIRSEVAS
ncbi:MAG TPA: acyl-CoA ligase (AMP-forming), exosortase A system-associated [Nocardioides sp.]|jgi:acyl-CoA ligase (AMP-forming) (exosortase A-associated)|nr:acyl-CoA ligase (AMP-forming), exosortase A system-associated [Nocardioides sp.]